FRMAASPPATGARYPPPPPLVTLLALTMGVFLVTLNVTVVTVALPDIQRSLNARRDELEWVIDAYNLVGASLLLSAGFFADRIGGGAGPDWWGWRAVFVVNAVAGLVALAIAYRVVPRSRSDVRRGLDIRGQLLAIVLLASLTYALIEAPRYGWASPRIVLV